MTTGNIRKSKWEGSKGQEVLGSISSSIDQDTKDLISNAKSRFFNPAYIRSPTVFFGFGEPKPFFFEKGPQSLVERLRHNVTFFYLNYTIIAAILFFLTLITSRAIIGILCLGLAWASFLKASSSGSLAIGSEFVFFYLLKQCQCMRLIETHESNYFLCALFD